MGSDIYSPNHVFNLPRALPVISARVQLVMILFKQNIYILIIIIFYIIYS